MATKGTSERIECLLLSFAERFVPWDAAETAVVLIPLRLVQQDLAALVGASRQQVNVALNALQRSGLLRLEPDFRITVLDLPALRRCHDHVLPLH